MMPQALLSQMENITMKNVVYASDTLHPPRDPYTYTK